VTATSATLTPRAVGAIGNGRRSTLVGGLLRRYGTTTSVPETSPRATLAMALSSAVRSRAGAARRAAARPLPRIRLTCSARSRLCGFAAAIGKRSSTGSSTSSAGGADVLGAVAQFERDIIQERRCSAFNRRGATGSRSVQSRSSSRAKSMLLQKCSGRAERQRRSLVCSASIARPYGAPSRSGKIAV